jgi:hypothetical protein
MTADVTISCPHCRRQYAMKIDPERLQRLKTRATCGRCGKTFDAASRIVAAQQPPPAAAQPLASETRRTDPRLPRVVEAPRPSIHTPSDVRDEMEELAREFAEAAARFTPVGIKRSSVGVTAALTDAPPATKPATVEEPTNPGVRHASVTGAAAESSTSAASPDSTSPASASAASATLAPSSALAPESRADADQLSLDAEPAGDEEFPPVPTLSRATAAPRSWLELADPGLAALQSPPSTGAVALESLLNEGESIALPPPPTAS